MLSKRHSAPTQIEQSPAPLPQRSLSSILFATAIDAAVKTFVLLILGRIAVSLIGGIFHDMTPTPPPGFGGAEAGSHARHSWHVSIWFNRNAFYPVFGILFAGLLWTRLNPASAEGTRSSRLQRIQRVLRERWFGLIVANAFGAFIAVMVGTWLQRFSLVQMLIGAAWGIISAPVHHFLHFLFGQNAAGQFDAWCGWFGQNQPRLDFWLIYFAAVCDDLGLPNIKTLARWFWRRIRSASAGKARAELESK